MKFGPVAPQEAIGAAAHTIRQGALVLKKGTLIGPVEAAALDAGGIKDIVVARLEPGDVSEDVAAAEIAAAITGEGVHVDRAFTGRANLFAETAGVLVVDKDAVDRLNRVDEAITVATLTAYKPVVPGEMIATVNPTLPPGMNAEIIHAGIALALEQMAERGWHVAGARVLALRPERCAAAGVERQVAGRGHDCERLDFFVNGDADFPELNRLFTDRVWDADTGRWERKQ
jgi:hypothetical protein